MSIGSKLWGVIGRLDYKLLVPLALFAGMAPWPAGPEPHLLEKLRWLMQGSLTKPLDIFDLVFHASPTLLIALRAVAAATRKDTEEPSSGDSPPTGD